MNNEDNLCHCGKPLHYSDKRLEEFSNKLIKVKGRYVNVTSTDTMKTYKVCRHYISLHGIEEAKLDQYGFEEVNNNG